MGEGLAVEVCVIVVSGILERDAVVQLSSVNDEAVGKIILNTDYKLKWPVLYVVYVMN